MTRLERIREALAVWEPADGEGEELAVPALAEVERAEAVIQAARACVDEFRIRVSPEHGRLLLALRALDEDTAS